MLLGLKLVFGSTQQSHFFFKLDGGETVKAQVVENAANTVQNADAAQKVLTVLKPEAQHLINSKTKDARCTWKGLANTPVECGVCALGCGDIVRGVCETVSSSRVASKNNRRKTLPSLGVGAVVAAPAACVVVAVVVVAAARIAVLALVLTVAALVNVIAFDLDVAGVDAGAGRTLRCYTLLHDIIGTPMSNCCAIGTSSMAALTAAARRTEKNSES